MEESKKENKLAIGIALGTAIGTASWGSNQQYGFMDWCWNSNRCWSRNFFNADRVIKKMMINKLLKPKAILIFKAVV